MIDEELVNLGEAMGGFELIGLSFECSFVCFCEGWATWILQWG